MAGKIKILLLVGSLNQGGAEFQLLSLARLLLSKGEDVEVLALTDYDYFLPYINEHGIRYSCIENKGGNLIRTLKAVKAINSKRPDLVIAYIKIVSQVAIAARIISGFRFKLIISERTSLIKPWHDKFYFNLANFANKITVNSISKLIYINRRFFLLRKKTVFIPNIINFDKYKLLEKVSAVNNEIRISYVGRISPEKNLLNLVRAIEVLWDKGYKINLSLYGAANNKKYFEEINKLIQELMLEAVVLYKGPAKDVTEVYKQTDLLCLVSIFEGFSNVLSEAICSGIPVIASSIEENRFLVEEGVNGFLAHPEGHEEIAGAIEKFLQLSPSQVSQISANNRQKAKVIFDEEKIYQSYLDIFKQIGFRENLNEEVPVNQHF